MNTLDDLIKRLQTLRERHGNVPVYQIVPDSIHGHGVERPLSVENVGFISENNPIRRSGDLDPQIDRVTIFRYPRFEDSMDDLTGIIPE